MVNSPKIYLSDYKSFFFYGQQPENLFIRFVNPALSKSFQNIYLSLYMD